MEQHVESGFFQLLKRATSGDSTAVSDLFDQVSSELRVIAQRRLRGVCRGSSLQTTVLIDDVFMHLLRGVPLDVRERTAYLRIAGHAMRDVVVDSIRSESAQKRGGGQAISQDLDQGAVDPGFQELVMITETIDKLTAEHPRTAQIILLHCLGGHTRKQVASMIDVSVPTIDRELALGRAWVSREMLSSKTLAAIPESTANRHNTQGQRT